MIMKILKNLISEKQLNICIYAMLTNNPEVYDNYLRSGPFFDNEGYLTVRTIKLFLYGALGSRGADGVDKRPVAGQAARQSLIHI